MNTHSFLACVLLTSCAVSNYRDKKSRPSPPADAAPMDFLGFSLFLKPQFRISVAPNSGQLQVEVELVPADA